MNNKLQAKDLINLGLFTVLYFVIGCCVAIPIGFVPIFLPILGAFRQRVYRRYGAYAHHRKNRHPHVCDFSLFPYNQRRISGDPGCHENAGYPLRWETSFADGGIQAGSFDGIRCKDW